MTYISTDKSSPVVYTAGEALDIVISFTAPEDGEYYLIGALYDSNFNFISGSMFGIILPTGATYAFNTPDNTQLFEMTADEKVDLTTKLTLDRTGVILGLFLMKMAGASADFDADTQIDSISLILAGSESTGIDLSSIISLMVVAGMAGIAVRSISD